MGFVIKKARESKLRRKIKALMTRERWAAIRNRKSKEIFTEFSQTLGHFRWRTE